MPKACSRMSDSEGCGNRESTGVAPLAIPNGRCVGGVVFAWLREFGDNNRLDHGGIVVRFMLWRE